MKVRELPYWLISGVAIFPVVIVLGLFFGILSGGRINYLFWLVIPSIIFEEIFETCCRVFSDSLIFNILFVGLFWFGTGGLTGLLSQKVQKVLK